MLKTARLHVARAGLADRITLAHGYAERLTPGLFGRSAPFDRAIFSYSLSMIPDWQAALGAARQALADDGTLHIVDFGDLTGLGRAGQYAMRAWLQLFHVEPRVEILRSMQAEIARNCNKNSMLDLLPGRYAFIFSGPRSVIPAPAWVMWQS